MDIKLTSSVSELIDFEEDKIKHEGGVRTNIIMKFEVLILKMIKKIIYIFLLLFLIPCLHQK